MTRRITKSAVVFVMLVLLLGAGTAASAQPKGAAATTTGFVSRSGTRLVVSGQPWRFAGYNLPCAQPFLLSDADLGSYLDNIRLNSGANVVRVWFFQKNGGPGNWGPFDRVIAALKSRGMRAIPTLANEWAATCEPTTAQKDLSWYQTGYKATGDGYPLSFRSYATQVAAHYAAEPTVAFWQLVNEAQAASAQGACDNTAAMNALRSFSDDVAGAMHQVDGNHLVDLGTQGTGQCGTSGRAAYTYVHAGALGLCEYHDYAAAGQAMPTDGANLLKERIADCNSLGKPLFVGESGIAGNVQPDGSEPPCSSWPNCDSPLTFQTLQQRATFFQAKIHAANAAGVVGYLIWFKSPFYAPASDRYAIGDGDPTEAVLPDALKPTPPVAVPEARWPILLLVPAMALIAVEVVRRRRRPRHQSADSLIA